MASPPDWHQMMCRRHVSCLSPQIWWAWVCFCCIWFYFIDQSNCKLTSFANGCRLIWEGSLVLLRRCIFPLHSLCSWWWGYGIATPYMSQFVGHPGGQEWTWAWEREDWGGEVVTHKQMSSQSTFLNIAVTQDARNSNEVRAKLKKIIVPTIIWQGDQIRCMKSTKTMQCKLCMMERREIFHIFRSDKSKIMNHNSEIFGTCKCNPRFHQFYQKLL